MRAPTQVAAVLRLPLRHDAQAHLVELVEVLLLDRLEHLLLVLVPASFAVRDRGSIIHVLVLALLDGELVGDGAVRALGSAILAQLVLDERYKPVEVSS